MQATRGEPSSARGFLYGILNRGGRRLKTDGRERACAAETRREAWLEELKRSEASGIRWAAHGEVRDFKLCRRRAAALTAEVRSRLWEWSGMRVPADCRSPGAALGCVPGSLASAPWCPHNESGPLRALGNLAPAVFWQEVLVRIAVLTKEGSVAARDLAILSAQNLTSFLRSAERIGETLPRGLRRLLRGASRRAAFLVGGSQNQAALPPMLDRRTAQSNS